MSLGNAFDYLTALRVPARARVPLAHSVHYFPWIGAAAGSLSVLFFLAVSAFFPNPAACLLAVLFPQLLAGFSPWRGLAEMAQGHRTRPGHRFRPGFRIDARGLGAVTVVLLIKWAALMMLPFDWQVRAAFVFPILGYCARTWAFLLDNRAEEEAEPVLIRGRRVRAGFLGAAMLFLLFFFPPPAALAVLAAAAICTLATLVLWNRATEGLTLQTAAVASEVAETTVLAGLAVSALVLLATPPA